MGRQSLAGERIEQILDAYGRCVVRTGVRAVTLVDVSAESGLSPSHIRHYVGNKSDLLLRFLDRLERRYVDNPLARVVEHAPDPAAAVVDYLLADEREPSADDAVIAVLVAGHSHDETLRDHGAHGQAAIIAHLHAVLAAQFPNADAVDVGDVAYQLAALGYGHWALVSMGVAPAAGAARRLGHAAVAVLRRA